jgi:hypothetical protein
MPLHHLTGRDPVKLRLVDLSSYVWCSELLSREDLQGELPLLCHLGLPKERSSCVSAKSVIDCRRQGTVSG